jgi:hypothetical protein
MVLCKSEGCDAMAKRNKEMCEECLELEIIPHKKMGKDIPKSNNANTGDVSLSDVMAAITAMRERDLVSLKQELNDRIDQFERNITESVKTLVREEIGAFKQEIKDDVGILQKKIETLEEKTASMNTGPDISRNIVIRNLPYEEEEDIETKVNLIFDDGLQISELKVESADRKPSYNGKPGVVVATMKSKADRKKLFEEKKKLWIKPGFENVMINPDKTYEERRSEANMNALIKAVGNDKLSMRGGRVLFQADRPNPGNQVHVDGVRT